jgi:hypothetical protein
MVRIKELAVQNILERKYRERGWGVKREVSTPVGYIDILLWKPRRDGSIERVLIEVKERGGLKSAVGQVEMYGKYEKCDRKVIIYFSYDTKDIRIPDSYYLLPGIEVESINRMFDINEVIEEQYRIDGITQFSEVTEEDICQEIFTSTIIVSEEECLVPLRKKDLKRVWGNGLNKEENSVLVQEINKLQDLQEVQLVREIDEELGLLGLTGIQSESIMW